MDKTLVCTAGKEPGEDYIQLQSGARVYLKDCPQDWPYDGKFIREGSSYFLIREDKTA